MIVATTLTMSLSTAGLGLLPTNTCCSSGWTDFGVVMLCIFRCFQGAAASTWRSDKGCIVAKLFREASLARLDARCRRCETR